LHCLDVIKLPTADQKFRWTVDARPKRVPMPERQLVDGDHELLRTITGRSPSRTSCARLVSGAMSKRVEARFWLRLVGCE